MKHELDISIAGLGIIIYSPFAVAHISEGSDYFSLHFLDPQMVAEHIMACRLSAVSTGSPGNFRLSIFDGQYPDQAVKDAMAAVRLGIEIQNNEICFRDLYDLMDWHRECPKSQRVTIPDGFYELTVFTTRPASGILGDNQRINLHFQSVAERPKLKWVGVPDISGNHAD